MFRRTYLQTLPFVGIVAVPFRRTHDERGEGFNPKAVASFTAHANHLARSRSQEFKRGVRIRS